MSEEREKTTNVPKCIGFIPDGNRRWAKERGLPAIQGHLEGKEKLKEVLRWCKEAGVKHAVVYAFSTENWKRPKGEVAGLTKLLKEAFGEFRKEHEGRISLHFVGDTEAFGKSFAQEMNKLEQDTRGHEYHLYVALSYGGRAEVLEGLKKLAREKTLGEIEKVTEEDFERYLWSADMPEPDLIIRTSGEKRLSNFMMWKSAYSELAFVESNFPALTKEEFFDALRDYGERKRRHGK